MDSRADMRNVTTILLSEDSSSSTGRVDIATWAMIPVQKKIKKKVSGRDPQCPTKQNVIMVRILRKTASFSFPA